MRHTIKAPLAPAVHAHGHTQHEMCTPHMQTLCGAKAQPTGHSSSELSPACPSPDSHATARLHTDACPLLLVISILALQENKTQVAPPQSCGRGSTPPSKTDPPTPPANTQDKMEVDVQGNSSCPFPPGLLEASIQASLLAWVRGGQRSHRHPAAHCVRHCSPAWPCRERRGLPGPCPVTNDLGTAAKSPAS